MSDIFIGRQAIYDRNLEVYAYELLFRAAQDDSANFIDGDQATSDVIVNTFMEIGLDNIVGKRRAFINLTRSFFVSEHSISLPRDRVVLEFLEDIAVDESILAGVQRLSAQGYSIALDDFIYHESLQPLVELADLIKIDIIPLSHDDIREHVRQLREYDIKLLAEKVETRDDLDFCMELGFDYFQGYYFSQPKVIHKQRLPNNRLAILRLLSKLQDPEITPGAIEELVTQDISFSFKILRYVNSAAFALPRKIESIQQAVIILGLNTIKSWVALLVMAGIENKPDELVNTALVRAKMAEEIALARKERHADAFFTVGLFSALDVLMDNTMEEILTQLPLADHISDALLHHTGPHGEVLACVLAYERGEWDLIQPRILNKQQFSDCYLKAIRWAGEVCQELID